MDKQRRSDDPIPDVLAEADELSEHVKTLALNLAIYLAKLKARAKSEHLDRLDPEFIRLVNGTVNVLREISIVLNAAGNKDKMAWEVPTGRHSKDQIEVKLHGILEQCTRVLDSLHQARDMIA